jgi:hypothetical protein
METGAAPQVGLVTDTGLPELDTVPFWVDYTETGAISYIVDYKQLMD